MLNNNGQLLVFKTEEQMQAYAVQWFHNNLPELRGTLHCNNNNSYNRIEGNKARSLGVYPGVSDLEWLVARGVTWYIEFKLPGKTQSEAQIKWENLITSFGHFYVLFEHVEDFQKFVCKVTGKELI